MLAMHRNQDIFPGRARGGGDRAPKLGEATAEGFWEGADERDGTKVYARITFNY
jgi:hypothetical protein